jgi:hypothetical protein
MTQAATIAAHWSRPPPRRSGQRRARRVGWWTDGTGGSRRGEYEQNHLYTSGSLPDGRCERPRDFARSWGGRGDGVNRLVGVASSNQRHRGQYLRVSAVVGHSYYAGRRVSPTSHSRAISPADRSRASSPQSAQLPRRPAPGANIHTEDRNHPSRTAPSRSLSGLPARSPRESRRLTRLAVSHATGPAGVRGRTNTSRVRALCRLRVCWQAQTE